MSDSGLPVSGASQSDVYTHPSSSVVRSASRLSSSARQSLINISLGMGIMLVALSGGVYLMMTNKEILLGGKASVDKQSSLSFAAPTQVRPGEPFTVDVMLDTSADPEYTISGADAVIQYTFTPEQQQFVGSGGGGVVSEQTQPFSQTEEPLAKSVGREVMDGSRLGLGAGGVSWEEQRRPMMYPMFALVKTEQGTIFDSYPTNPNKITVPPPEPRPSAEPPIMSCGGFAGTQCPNGYLCRMDDAMRNVPDASGVCVRSVDKETQQNQVLGVTTQSKELAAVPYEAFEAKPQQMFAPMPSSQGAVLQGTTSISGVKNYAVDDQGYFKGFTGKGVFARLTFVANTTGKVELKFAYSGENATDDSNVMGFLKTVPVNIQKASERLLTTPASIYINVTKPALPTPSPTLSPTCAVIECKAGYECYQPPMPDCAPGLACIQMMPAPTCRPVPMPTPIPTMPPPPTLPPTPTPVPTSTPRPENRVSWRTGAVSLEADDFSILINRNEKLQWFYGRTGNMTIHSDMNATKPTLELSWTENGVPMRLYMYLTNSLSSWGVTEMRTDDGSAEGHWMYFRYLGIKALPGEVFISPDFSMKSTDRGSYADGDRVVSYVTFKNLRLQSLLSAQPTPSPTPPPPNTSLLNVSLSLEGRSTHATRALVYKVVPGGESLLGQVKIDEYGNGSLSLLDNTVLTEKALRLFVEVPGYLRAYSQSAFPVKSVDSGVLSTIVNAKFGMLTAGDVYIGAGGFGDHQVNTADVAELYTQWSPATEPITKSNGGVLTGDLNGDGIVNNRDYVMLMLNFGKKTAL